MQEQVALTSEELVAVKSLLQSPAAQPWRVAQERHVMRQQLVDEIAELNAKLEKELPELRREEEAAGAKVLEMKALLKDAELRHAAAVGKYRGLDAQCRGQISRREGQLRNSAHPAIGEFIAQCRREIDKLRFNVETFTHTSEAGRVTYSSNVELVEQRVSALTAAIKEAENFYCSALADNEVETRLHQLAVTIAQPGQIPQYLPGHDVERSVLRALTLRTERYRTTKNEIRSGMGFRVHYRR